MHEKAKRLSNGMSRRAVILDGIVSVAGIATMIATNTNARAANKLPQTAVAYRATPNGDKKCSNCVLFEAPDACKSVAGVVSPDGFCILWKKS
jgi:hypothetical protein